MASKQPPATPTYILRGHAAPIHALHLFANNSRLVSADAEGWVVVWDMVSKRPVVSWKAHRGAVLEAKGFTSTKGTEIYTHGRDHKLRVWRVRRQDEEFLDRTLPVDASETEEGTKNQPWMVHSLPVNALNFCAFDMIFIPGQVGGNLSGPSTDSSKSSLNGASQSPMLIAVPNALNSGAIDIFHLPSERRLSTIPADTTANTGMVMAVRLLISPSSGELYAASAYEDGHVMVHVRRGHLNAQDITTSVNVNGMAWRWEKVYGSRSHSQPVLSIDLAPSKDYFLSSSADALLVRHLIPLSGIATGHMEDAPLKTVHTKHAGQQALRIRSDGKIFATAGWDCRVRVYSCKTMRELAVLKWHQDGCYAAAFAEVPTPTLTAASETQSEPQGTEPSENDTQLMKRREGLAAVQHQRSEKAQMTHWLAAGSKDGKISLWDIY